MGNKNFNLSIGIKKQAMVNALEASLGNISKAARQAKITPRTHYRWMEEDMEYNQQVIIMKNINNGMMKDSLLSAAFKKIQEGDSAVLNQLLRIFLKKLPDEIDLISKKANPLSKRISIKIAHHPTDFYSKDPMTQLAVRQYMETKEKEGTLGEIRQDLVKLYKDGGLK